MDQAMIVGRRLEAMADRGIKVAAWTVNDPVRAKSLLDDGVISIISDTLVAEA